jgi:uncharacterized phage-associated protein
MYDSRGIANLVLDVADNLNVGVTNLQLQKILYFVWGEYHRKYGRDLFKESFSAWEYGPVVPDIYHSFKIFGNRNIHNRISRLDFKNGSKVKIILNIDGDERIFLESVINLYVRVSAGTLVDWSHHDSGPWAKVWNHTGPSNPGMIIPFEAIRRYFQNPFPFNGAWIGKA